MLMYLGTGERHYGDRPIAAYPRAFWEFQAVIRGLCAPTLPDAEPFDLVDSRLWVIPPGVEHGWRGVPGDTCEVVVLQFDQAPPSICEVTATCDGSILSTDLTEPDRAELAAIAASVQSDYLQPRAWSDLRFEAALLRVSLLALRAATPPGRAGRSKNVQERRHEQARRKVRQALAWYGEHMSEGGGVEAVARAVHVSTSHLRRLFVEATGEPPLAAMRRLQVERARTMLARGETVKQVAHGCGFSGVSVFSRAFKQATGASPIAWRG